MASRKKADLEIQAIHTPPYSLEAEESVLGALLIDNTASYNIADVIKAEDFYEHSHRLIFEHIFKLISASRPADVLTVSDSLRSIGKEAETGGMEYLNSLAQNTPSAANIRRYAEIVRDRSILRRLISVGGEISTAAMSPTGREAKEILDEAQAKVMLVSEEIEKGSGGFLDMPTVLTGLTSRLKELYENQSDTDVTGIPTGFSDLDRQTSGLQDGDLVIVAGRPSMGKTAFSINIAEHIAVNQGMPVAVFSMEMSAEQLVMRLISSVGRIDASKMRNARFDAEEWERFYEAVNKLKSAPLYIDETPGLSILSLRSRARQLKNRYGRLGLIVVDYLQLMSGESGSENRATEISDISRGLKGLAKELKTPVIALSQLNRSVEQRPNKRPMMSDLRESGAIEQDADLIVFLYRDWVYNKESPDTMAEAIVGKQRNGPVGTIPLVFLGKYTRFENAAKGWQDDPQFQGD